MINQQYSKYNPTRVLIINEWFKTENPLGISRVWAQPMKGNVTMQRLSTYPRLAVSCCFMQFMQTTISNQSGNRANWYLASNCSNHCSVVWSSWAFSLGDIDNYRKVQGAISNVACHVNETSCFTLGLRGHQLKTTAWKEDHAFLCIMRRTVFLLASKIRVELIKRTGHSDVVCMV